MFAPYASIRVDQGVLKILGDINSPVLLAPTVGLTAEYGDTTIANTTVWDGIYFGPSSNGTVLGGANTYVSGSIIRYCTVQYGGYFKRTASIYLDRVGVALDQVSILGTWDRSVSGIYLYYPQDPVFLHGLSVTDSGNYGMYMISPASSTSLVDVNIKRSKNYGLYMSNSKETSIFRSSFHDNSAANSNSRQVYSTGGELILSVVADVLHLNLFSFKQFHPIIAMN